MSRQKFTLNFEKDSGVRIGTVQYTILRSPGIDSQPGGIDSWAPYTFTNTDTDDDYSYHVSGL